VEDDIAKEMAVKKENFEWQMNYLKRKGYHVISMDEAYDKLRQGSIGRKDVVIAFDDGYRDFYHNAFPILQKYGYPCILYLVPGCMGTDCVFWWDRDLGESPLLDWSEIHELLKSGKVALGSHTLHHKDLDGLGEAELKQELEMSKSMIEKNTGREVLHFSYPRGIYSRDAEECLRSLYRTGVLVWKGKNRVSGDKGLNFYQLKRIPVHNSDGKFLFAARLKGWLIAEEWLRNMLSMS